MSTQRLYRWMTIAAFAGVAAGSFLYAANSPYRVLARVSLLAGLLLLLAWAALNRRKIIAFLRRRSSRYGANSLVAVAAFLSIVVVVQALSSRHSFRYDVTGNRRFSLAEQTVAVLDALSRDMHVTAFYKRGTTEEALARDLLDQFRHRTRRLDFEFIDPDQKPQRARDLGVYAFGTTVVEAGERRETLARLSEEDLLNAVVKVTKDTTRPVCFVKGHGERDPSDTDRSGYSIAAVALEREGFEVRPLSLLDEASVPDDCVVVVVAGPRKDYLESEIMKIEEHLDRGRGALFLIDPHADLPNVEGLLARVGVIVNDDAVVDPISRTFGGDYSIPVVTEYEDHPITRGFEFATFFPTARSLALTTGSIAGATAEVIARTGKSAWGETDLDLIDKGQAVKGDDDNAGPLPIAAVARKKAPPRPQEDETAESVIVVFGDSDFAANASFRMSGNSDLFLNVVDYLARDENLIAVRPKTGRGDRLFLTAAQGRLIFLLSMVLLPLAVIGCGTAVWSGRRRRN